MSTTKQLRHTIPDTDRISVPDAASATALWRFLVIGLIAVIGVSIIMIGILLAMRADPAVLVTITTAAMTGLFGLFIPPSKTPR